MQIPRKGRKAERLMDVRLATKLIVKRGNVFLVGRILGSRELRWSTSPYDAWSTRSKESAMKVAKKIGGDLWLFNPIAGQLRMMNLTE